MRNRFQAFLPHAIGPLYTFMLTMLLELLGRNTSISSSLALVYVGLAVSAVFGGLRSNLVSATVIIAYGVIEFNFDSSRIVQNVLAVYSIAFVNGYGRRLLIKWYKESEYYRQKAIDTFNGNRTRMVEALDYLDRALEARDIVEIKRLIQVARIKQADTLTLADSWHEMAKDKRLAVEAIEESAGYPWRADEKIKNIDMVVHEILKEVYRIRRIVEAADDGD